MTKNINEYESLSSFLDSTTSMGSIDRAQTNTLYGINKNANSSIDYGPFDDPGYVFMTRPQLNLRSNNIINIRKFYPLLSKNPNSIEAYIRATLDPRLFYNTDGDKLDCPLVDDDMAFMSIISNTVESVSGWPDIVYESHITAEGMRKQQQATMDSIGEINSVYDLNLTFKNTYSETVLNLISIWGLYISTNYEGLTSPYADFIASRTRDYDSRLYRIVLDENRRKVRKIASNAAMYPKVDAQGMFFDFSRKLPYNEQTKEFTVPFVSMGAFYNDPIIIREFNKAVAIFNPEMRKIVYGKTSTELVKLSVQEFDSFGHRGYPHINEITLDFEWYVKKSTYELYNNKG